MQELAQNPFFVTDNFGKGNAMLIGAAHVDITPDVPFFMQGSSMQVLATKTLDSLHASCVVCESHGTMLALVSCDLLCVPDEAILEIRSRVNALTGIPASHIMIMATHTHNGPRMTDEELHSGGEKDQAIYNKIINNIVLSVKKACDSRVPGKIGYGKSLVDRCGHNRRYIMSDGRSKTNPKPHGHDPDRLMVEGPADKEVQVLWFEDLDENLLAVMVNFTSHPVTMIKTEYTTADYPGSMRMNIQKLLGDNLPVLFLQGAAGNIMPRDVESERLWGKGLDAYKRIGRILACEAVKIISSMYTENKQDIALAVVARELLIPYRDIPAAEVARIKKRWEQLNDDEIESLPFDEKMYSRSALHLGELRKTGDVQRVPLSAFRIDDVFFVTAPCEYFVEYQLELKRKYSNYKIVAIELANGVAPDGYVPTRQAIALGGYESYTRMLCDEAGDLILNAWIEMVASLVSAGIPEQDPRYRHATGTLKGDEDDDSTRNSQGSDRTPGNQNCSIQDAV
jgi:hypothetical protein